MVCINIESNMPLTLYGVSVRSYGFVVMERFGSVDAEGSEPEAAHGQFGRPPHDGQRGRWAGALVGDDAVHCAVGVEFTAIGNPSRRSRPSMTVLPP